LAAQTLWDARNERGQGAAMIFGSAFLDIEEEVEFTKVPRGRKVPH